MAAGGAGLLAGAGGLFGGSSEPQSSSSIGGTSTSGASNDGNSVRFGCARKGGTDYGALAIIGGVILIAYVALAPKRKK